MESSYDVGDALKEDRKIDVKIEAILCGRVAHWTQESDIFAI
jgi:hypothetical protein